MALLAIDVVSRASFLAPRLATYRGASNYVVASAALWIVLRLLLLVPRWSRAALFALLVALPMAVEWSVFRSYGAFVTPTDFVVFSESPRVIFQAAGATAESFGTAIVFALALASAWLLPPVARPLRWWRTGLATVLLATVLGVGASYWRAAPTLEHSQPAFSCALVGVMRRASVRTHGSPRIALPRAMSTASRPNVVLILGESLAASHLSLYGYDRPTTPRLQALADKGELVALRDAVVSGPNTRASIPYIVTGLAGPDPEGRVVHAPTVLEYAKAQGYHTAFVSAQEESWGGLDAILREGADTFRSGIQFATEVDVMKGGDDLVVLEKGVLPALRALEEPFFVVVHMDGSHAPYAHHAPPSHKVFAEDGVNSIGAYDNTVRVTDEYVARVFETLRARDPNAWLFFTSDHGQALGQGGGFYNRGYQSNVVNDPLLVFPPPVADRERWSELVNAQVSACDLAPTILHVMGTKPAAAAAMDCVDWLAERPRPHVRVVSAYTPVWVGEQTMLVLRADGQRALYDMWRGTVTRDDGVARPSSEFPIPPEVLARLSPATAAE